MSVITPAPQPKSDIFREVEQLQNSFKIMKVKFW